MTSTVFVPIKSRGINLTDAADAADTAGAMLRIISDTTVNVNRAEASLESYDMDVDDFEDSRAAEQQDQLLAISHGARVYGDWH
ncbi:hypothetical protein EYZ11_013389 [Aspergillus tanneri]|uniref:Uncharacterized protein n=1 Tax=Aspergillus tanneri TaxID=1220188 RepID=A0A4V3UMG6_9EURO|nr:uncharacterized protein ATNIH1004_011555 [Aspergillus tanneri]KAA8642610.1 hypothetical protein ATNIH1004_011555 [Aspergillus tanneri]THC87164.1 hypothetical protein EYZ11_013389 [Aspergillus tanneri]